MSPGELAEKTPYCSVGVEVPTLCYQQLGHRKIDLAGSPQSFQFTRRGGIVETDYVLLVSIAYAIEECRLDAVELGARRL